MKAFFKSTVLVLLLAVTLSSCIVAGPGYYRPRYHRVYGPVIRPISHPHFYGGHHRHYRGDGHYRR